MTGIEWREVPTHSGYKANRAGLICGPRGRVLRPMQMESGHLYVITPRPRSPRKLFVHRAVLFTFVGPPSDPAHEVRHLDGNPANNRLDNLAWGTRLENAHDKALHGTQPKGEGSCTAKLTAAQVMEIRRLHGTVSLRLLGKRFGVSHTAIRRAALGIKWKELE